MPLGMATVTGPGIFTGVFHHRRAHGVKLNVAIADQQIPLGIDYGRPVAAFPKSPGSLVVAVEVLDVASAHRLHHLADTHFRVRRHQEMHMVGHENIGVDIAAVSVRCHNQALS